MAPTYQQISSRAQARWESLVAGNRPWIRIGTALCGQAAGSEEVFQAIETALAENKLEANLSRVGCLGLCFAEPLVDVQMPNGPRVFYGNVTPQTVRQIVNSHIGRGIPVPELALGYLAAIPGDGAAPGGDSEPENIPNLDLHPMRVMETRIALRNAGTIDPTDIHQYVANGGYRALHEALTDMTAAETLERVAASGLRGRGGAAFPAATKWRFLAGSNAPTKYILCNCEEGDPGAFNDKAILESDPHTLIEGLLLCGYATGANHGYIFIRHGHDGPIDTTREASGRPTSRESSAIVSLDRISTSKLKWLSPGTPTWPERKPP